MHSDESPVPIVPGSRGFVFATTGKQYTRLARRAARTMRQIMPHCIIDLFTDQPIRDTVFDQIHALDDDWFRPKMRAIRDSRFERTVVMDADMVVVADISDLFQVLDEYDIAGVEAKSRVENMIGVDAVVPRCVPPINTGLLVVRASARLRTFAQVWEDDVRASKSKIDQPSFRRLLYQSDLRYCPIGSEYNTLWLEVLHIWPEAHGAPRILHVRGLHKRPAGDPKTPFSLKEAIGDARAQRVEQLLGSDWSLQTGAAP